MFISEAFAAWRRGLPRWTLRGAPRLLAKLMFNGPALVLLGTVALIALAVRVTVDDPGVGLWLLIFSPVYSSLFMLTFALVRGAMGWGGVLTESIRAAMMQQRRCTGCGYALGGAVAESDGCVVCPECGAAWDARKLGLSAAQARDVVVVTGWKRPETPPSE